MGTSLLDEYHQQQAAPAPDSSSFLSEYRARQQPDTSGSLLDEYRASQPSKPSLLSRVGQAAKSLLPTAEDQALYGPGATAFAGPAIRMAQGIGKQTAQDVKTLALGGLGDFLKPGDAVQAPSLQSQAGAGLRVGLMAGGAGVLGKGAGALASRILPEAVAAPVARVATGAAAGAAFSPTDPAVGAVVGGATGAVPEVGGAVPVRKTLTQMSPSELVDRAAAAGYPDLSRGTNGVEIPLEERGAIYANTPMSPSEMVEQAVQAGLKDTSRGTRPVAADATAVAPPSTVTGEEANPQELQEMFSGPGIPTKVKKSLRQFYRGGFIDARPLLDQPEDQPLKGEMNRVGAADTFGNSLATYGGNSVRAAVSDPAKIPQIEARINAANMTARADARQKAADLATDAATKAQLTQEASNLRGHAAYYDALAGPDIRQSPDYAAYVNRFNEVIAPRLKQMATQGGLPESKLLSIPDNAPYVPTVSDMEKVPPEAVLAPNVPRKPGTKLSSATQRATGGALEYMNDIPEQIRAVAPARQRVAAQNMMWQRVKDAGRPVAKDAALEPGEVRVAFTDGNKITTPTSPNATQFVAVPQRVAQSVSDQLARMAPPNGGADPFARGLRYLQGKMTKGAVKIAPIMTKVHGYNIISTVGQTPSASLAGNVGASLPFGAQIGGAAALHGIDFTDPAVASKMLDYAEYGGTHPIATDMGARPLFGASGLDPRGRFVLGQRREALHPEESPAQVAQYLTENLGNYNRSNQPGFVRSGQASGVTTFAPAGTAFTRSAARRVLPIFPGMTPAERLATLGRTVGSAVGGANLVNYLKTGQSTFSNAAGHRFDIDLGSKNDQDQENYIRFGSIFPMVNRGLEMTGIRPVIEGQGIGGAVRGPVNEMLTQAGVLPRAGLAMLMNAQPRLGPGMTAVPAAPPQFSDAKTLANMGMRGAFGSLGAASALAGTSPFDADRSLGTRAMDALGLNFTSEGTRGGKTSAPAGYDEKLQAAIYKVSDAKTMADKQSIIRQTVQDATDAGYSGWYLENLRRTLAKTAGKTMPHAAP